MQISRSDTGATIKLKDTAIYLGGSLAIGEYALPGPGEYEVAGVMVEATAAAARFSAEDVTIGYLADRTKKLSDQELEELGPVDILFFSLAIDALTPKLALEILAQIEAPVIIPLGNRELLDAFCAGHGQCESLTGPLKLTRSQLPAEGSRVIALS